MFFERRLKGGVEGEVEGGVEGETRNWEKEAGKDVEHVSGPGVCSFERCYPVPTSSGASFLFVGLSVYLVTFPACIYFGPLRSKCRSFGRRSLRFARRPLSSPRARPDVVLRRIFGFFFLSFRRDTCSVALWTEEVRMLRKDYGPNENKE